MNANMAAGLARRLHAAHGTQPPAGPVEAALSSAGAETRRPSSYCTPGTVALLLQVAILVRAHPPPCCSALTGAGCTVCAPAAYPPFLPSPRRRSTWKRTWRRRAQSGCGRTLRCTTHSRWTSSHCPPPACSYATHPPSSSSRERLCSWFASLSPPSSQRSFSPVPALYRKWRDPRAITRAWWGAGGLRWPASARPRRRLALPCDRFCRALSLGHWVRTAGHGYPHRPMRARAHSPFPPPGQRHPLPRSLPLHMHCRGACISAALPMGVGRGDGPDP